MRRASRAIQTTSRRNRCLVIYCLNINGYWARQGSGELFTCRNLRSPPWPDYRKHQLKCIQSEEEGILLRERHFSTNPWFFLPRIICTFGRNLAPIQFGSSCKPMGKENAGRGIEKSAKTRYDQASSINWGRLAGYVFKFLLFMAF